MPTRIQECIRLHTHTKLKYETHLWVDEQNFWVTQVRWAIDVNCCCCTWQRGCIAVQHGPAWHVMTTFHVCLLDKSSLSFQKNKNMFTYFPSRRRSWFYLTKTNNIFRDALVPSIGYWRLTLRAEVRSPSLFYFWLAPNELLGWERMRFFPHIIGWWIQLAWTNCTFKFFTVVQMVTPLSRTLNNWLTIIYYIILPG